MKLVTKFVSVLSTITILSLFSGTSFVKADVVPETVQNNASVTLSNKQLKEASIIQNNLSLEKIDGIYQFSFDKNDQFTKYALKSVKSDLSMDEIAKMTNDLNEKLKEENGNGRITEFINQMTSIKQANDMDRASKKKNRKAACSWVIGGAGLFHSALYTYAAGALGATGPAGWIVYGVGAAYTAAGMAICR